MNRIFLYFLMGLFFTTLYAQEPQPKWIGANRNQSATNTWIAYRKTVNLSQVPEEAPAKIAVDSKYWLWINGRLVVFEGGLKRGPNPLDTYYDEVDIASFLQPGENIIAVLVWYFGKDGFSHKSSGRAGLLFDCRTRNLNIVSDRSWQSTLVSAYRTASPPMPNSRLPESSVLYDAREELGNWQSPDYGKRFDAAPELADAGAYPWNQLIKRPIPLWKDYGLKDYENSSSFPTVSTGEPIVCKLPYNAMVSPYLKIEASEGDTIVMCTDNYLTYDGGATNLRGEYITKSGVQEYEHLPWINGHTVHYFIPKGVKILELKYRETGYDTEFSGSFTSSDDFLNRLWEKSKRTLYITMRDTYMDCPDRERAQWTGDAVNESGEAFYALSVSSHDLAKKWLYELIGWQRADGSLYAPVPSGNYFRELPGQVLASVGYYGLWNYYLHTGDKQIISDLYRPIQRYLELWEQDGNGTVKMRQGEWTWGDWGTEKDILLLYNLWYYIAVKGMHEIAVEIGQTNDAAGYAAWMKTFKESFNRQFWTGTAYRDPAYTGKTDDRAQALAVVAGVADKDKYPALLKVFQTEEHASPYMEKYVFEAMMIMGYENEAIARHKKRFEKMVNHPFFTTLFEGWGIGKEGFGGGTVNHAWSGGALTILSQYVCGIAPLEPGYSVFRIQPQPGSVDKAAATITSVAGTIRSAYELGNNRFTLTAEVPESTQCVISLPSEYRQLSVNGKEIWKNGKSRKSHVAESIGISETGHIQFKIGPGKWNIIAKN